MAQSLTPYGTQPKGRVRPGLRIVDRTYPRTHKPVKSAFGMSGSMKDIQKMAMSGLKSNLLGLPGNHPYASMAFLLKMMGDTPQDPNAKARQLGYKDAKEQLKRIKDMENRKGQLTIR